jgi:excisionase family DNA binding protein
VAPDSLPLDVDTLADAIADRLAARTAETARQRYLTVQHAAEYVDVSTDTIRSLLASGKLTALRPVPGRVVIDRRELDALLASSTKQPKRGRGIYDRAEKSEI